MTAVALYAHPRWADFSGVKDARGLAHPPLRGWVAAPVLRPTGELWGVRPLSDTSGDADVTSADLDLLIHLAHRQFVPPDLHPTCTLPVRPRGCSRAWSGGPARDARSVPSPRAPSAHYVMAYPRSRRRYLYAALSRGPGTWHGVAP